tara:strand:- start:11 stop:133 length:123 start_codon:yes stop_codon:yes gene_type:complete
MKARFPDGLLGGFGSGPQWLAVKTNAGPSGADELPDITMA